MYFKDLVPPDADYDHYQTLLRQLSDFVVDCVSFPLKAYGIVEHASYGDGKMHHSAVLMLTRHFCEQIDGIAVLAAEGCAEPSKPLLRSAFEASIGIRYILENDSERRGLAYHVAHAHRRMKLYRKLDPNEQAGQELRKKVKGDPIGEDILNSLPAFDLPKLIARLTGMLQKPPYDVVEAEWKKRKKDMKGDPPWFSLFGGPRSISALANQLGKAFWYQLMYSDWSDVVHAGSGMEHVAEHVAGDGGPVVIRPLRHPDGLQSLIVLVAGLCLELSRALLGTYGSDEQRREMRDEYIVRVQKRMKELTQVQLINASWR